MTFFLKIVLWHSQFRHTLSHPVGINANYTNYPGVQSSLHRLIIVGVISIAVSYYTVHLTGRSINTSPSTTDTGYNFMIYGWNSGNRRYRYLWTLSCYLEGQLKRYIGTKLDITQPPPHSDVTIGSTLSASLYIIYHPVTVNC